MTSDQPLLDAIMLASDAPDVDMAPLACRACRHRKSRCDKALPKCSACTRRKRACEYARAPKQRSSPAPLPPSDRWRHSPRYTEDHGPVQTIDLPTMLFLDPNIISHGQVETVQVPIAIPDHILPFVGDFGDIVATATKSFEHIDPWMSFISRKRFFDLHLTSSFRNRPDVVLLVLALKLIATLPSPGLRSPRTPLYHALKQFYLETETSSILSIQVLQAGILIALYEVGHGIYPAAFLSIGACARYAHVMGLGFKAGTGINKVLTLLEFEERRRVWWAIVILDRFVNIGCPGRPFATADPKLSDILPVNDEAWDEGVSRNASRVLHLSDCFADISLRPFCTGTPSPYLRRHRGKRVDLRIYARPPASLAKFWSTTPTIPTPTRKHPSSSTELLKQCYRPRSRAWNQTTT
nr:hypothetical protein CFP56_25854 [Quercus suber]